MELDVTEIATLIHNGEYYPMAGSIAEHGRDAGRITWENCLQFAREHVGLFRKLGKACVLLPAIREYFRDAGMDETDTWTTRECLAILAQYIALQIWEGRGQQTESLYRGDDGRIYLYLGM